MIWCVTLNPALDVSYPLSGSLVEGAVHRASTMDAQLGGKGNNVARVVKQLGGPVTTVQIFGGAVGEHLLRQSRAMGLETVFRRVADESRICLTFLSPNGAVSEVRPPGPYVTSAIAEELLDDLVRQVRPGDWVTLSGSLPPGLPDTTYGDWIRVLTPRVSGILVDTSGQALLEAMDARPTAVTPNGAEYQAMQESSSALCCPVVMTDGANGVVWYRAGEEPRGWQAPPVHVVNPVGAGDTFVGALVTALASGTAWEEAIPEAVAAASASVETLGVAVIDPGRVKTLRKEVKEVRVI